jgi:transposase
MLRPLPVKRFEIEAWNKATVNIDYHVEFERGLYSVPYQHVRKAVEIRATLSTVEIFLRGERIASHVRLHKPYDRSTITEHQPRSHREHQQWPPSRIIAWAANNGPHTAKLVERILADKPHPEMGYRSCLGIIRLGEKYSSSRLEAACERALLIGAIGYKHVSSTLKRGLDRQPLPAGTATETNATTTSGHDNIRGAEYYA